jgi:hypothetical protein
MVVSYYKLNKDDLRRAAMNLQIGAGIGDRIATLDVDEFLADAEAWAESQISEFVAVPLKPIPERGEITVPGTPTKRNYNIEFILAVTYSALSRLLQSEFFENEPNASKAGEWAKTEAAEHILNFRSRSTNLVGSGRRRHLNPFMPPNIAPREAPPQG